MVATDVSTRPAATSDLAQRLGPARYLNLSTFRKNGEAVATPVWFAVVGDRAYIVTEGTAGKAKRIRNNPRVLLAPSDWRGRATGAASEATARIVADPAETATAERALRERYGWQWRMIVWFGARRQRRSGKPDNHVFLAVALDS